MEIKQVVKMYAAILVSGYNQRHFIVNSDAFIHQLEQ